MELAEAEAAYRLALIAEMQNSEAVAHIQRVGAYCTLVASALGFSPTDAEFIGRASALHDLGKVAVPAEILAKRAPLTEEEWVIVKRHPVVGERLLMGSPLPLLAAAATIARSHHERWDGTGYPDRLAGEAIPLSARICAVADVFDALTSVRPYKAAYAIDTALHLIRSDRGTHFDPGVVDAFLGVAGEAARIRKKRRGVMSRPVSQFPGGLH